jgi:hypothetical protein
MYTPSKGVYRDEQESIDHDGEGLEGHKLENIIIEHRAFTRPEIHQYRQEFSQKGEKDVTYLEQVWSSGADSLELSDNEMKQLSGINENACIFEGLLIAMEACPKAVMSLIRWLSEAWHIAIRDLDFSTLEVNVSWKTLDDAIKLTRKLGILYKIYHNKYLMPVAAPPQPEMKKIIINGAPAHMRLSNHFPSTGPNPPGCS